MKIEILSIRGELRGILYIYIIYMSEWGAVDSAAKWCPNLVT